MTSIKLLPVAIAVAGLASATLMGCSSDDDSPSPGGGGNTSAYERLGKHEGLFAFVKGEVENKILADSNLKTYFFSQVAKPIPAGHPSAFQIEECFTRLVASVIQAETYPGPAVNDPANANTPNFTCRNMKASHTGLKIGDKTFDAFVGILAADLQPLIAKDGPPKMGQISQEEFNALAAALTGTKGDIVDTSAAPGPVPFPG